MNVTTPNHFGTAAARQLKGLARFADRVTLWQFPDEQHVEAVIEGVCQCTLREYHARLAAAVAEFTRQGVPVVIVRASVRELLNMLAKHNLPLTPDGQAAAIGLLASEIR